MFLVNEKTEQVTKKIALLRHGEAAVGHGRNGDLSRPLTDGGRAQLDRLQKILVANDIQFDYALYSPATRTTQTLEILAGAVPIGQRRAVRDIYEASLGDLMQLIHGLPTDVHDVLLVGHNPGISHLLSYLSGDSSVVFSPGMLVRLVLEIDDWTLASRSSAYIMEVMQ